MKTDIKIAQSVELQPIVDSKKVGIDYEDLGHGKYRPSSVLTRFISSRKSCRQLILVTAINPNSGWRRVSRPYHWTGWRFRNWQRKLWLLSANRPGTSDGYQRRRSCGGHAQALPMEDINHFTGDVRHPDYVMLCLLSSIIICVKWNQVSTNVVLSGSGLADLNDRAFAM